MYYPYPKQQKLAVLSSRICIYMQDLLAELLQFQFAMLLNDDQSSMLISQYFTSLRANSVTLAPLRTTSAARALPIPLEPPVT